MTMPDLRTRTARVKKAIEEGAYVRAKDEAFVTLQGELRHTGWLFDMRRVVLHADMLDDISALFWNLFGENKNIQIGTIETAGIPLLIGFLAHSKMYTGADVSGFYIRKSRKKNGLMKLVEGEVQKGKDIVLVDDLMNSGKSFMRQVETVESLGGHVKAIWMLIRFRDPEYYEYFNKKGIAVHSLFELNDFTDTLGTANLLPEEPPHRPAQHFDVVWKFEVANPSYHHVVPKSDPVLDNERVYIGSDQGEFLALNQIDGSIAWSHTISLHRKGKGIFSSPALCEGTVYFGGYDGNVYALDSKTGKRKWLSSEGDWVGSSPSLAPDLGMLFVGLEFGLWRKRGGIVALDMKTGRKIWGYYEMPCFTHSSPLYIKKHGQVVIGSNDGTVYLFDAKAGTLLWKFATGVLSDSELDSGFSRFDIKESFAYDAKRDLIVFGNYDGKVFFVDRKTGLERGHFTAGFGFYSTPVIYENTVIVTSLDKHVYCVDLDTFREKWRWYAGARIFATPVIIEGSLYVGANTGVLAELDPETGSERSSFLVTERITNKVVYNPKTQRFFLPTFANELYCLKRKV